MLVIPCAFIDSALILLGSSGNGLCILVFLRQKFRHRIITPYFIALLAADSIYLAFRLIKLFYYSQTLFKSNTHSAQSCANTFFARAYHHATQTWPQLLVPLVHPETYMRFSLILMCIISVQRTTFISRSLNLLRKPDEQKTAAKHRRTFLFILLAILVAYVFEFNRLTLFCSSSGHRELFYEWFVYMSRHMKNATYLFKNNLRDQPKSLDCVNHILKRSNDTAIVYEDSICTKDQLMDILSSSFDQHQRSIVNLIQNILFHQTGHRVARNEIHRKFHFHECLFPQEPGFFYRHYNFMYNRMFGFNRFTLILGKIFVERISTQDDIVDLAHDLQWWSHQEETETHVFLVSLHLRRTLPCQLLSLSTPELRERQEIEWVLDLCILSKPASRRGRKEGLLESFLIAH